jgi:hypothetical protein
MDGILRKGRLLFAIAVMALGMEHIVCAWFGVVNKTVFPGETVFSVIPWVPAYPWIAYGVGLALLVAGMLLAIEVRPRLAATLLGILFLAFLVLLEARRLIHFGQRTGFFETLALCGSALTLAATLPSESPRSGPSNRMLDLLVASGRYLFAFSAIIFGIDHLLFLRFVATLVPSWIPWHLFWAYFTAFAFIAAGVSIGTRWLASWASLSLGTMFLLWFVVLHLPRSFGLSAAAGPGAPHNPDEWSSAFIALAMAGGSWIMACQSLTVFEKRDHPQHKRDLPAFRRRELSPHLIAEK